MRTSLVSKQRSSRSTNWKPLLTFLLAIPYYFLYSSIHYILYCLLLTGLTFLITSRFSWIAQQIISKRTSKTGQLTFPTLEYHWTIAPSFYRRIINTFLLKAKNGRDFLDRVFLINWRLACLKDLYGEKCARGGNGSLLLKRREYKRVRRAGDLQKDYEGLTGEYSLAPGISAHSYSYPPPAHTPP